MAVPTFVVDAPGGGGKIPLQPNYLLSQSDIRYVLRNYEGMITTYTQPPNIYSECHCQFCKDHRYRPLDGVDRRNMYVQDSSPSTSEPYIRLELE